MVKFLSFFLSLSLVCSSYAAVKRSTSVKVADITEIYVNDPVKNLLVVKAKDGRLLKLNVSMQQREEIVAAVEGYQVASTESVPTPGVATPLKAPAETTLTAKAEDTGSGEKKSPWSKHFFYFGSVGTEDIANREGTLSHYLEFGIGYQFHENWKFTVKPNVSMKYNLESGSAKNDLGDLQFELNRGKFASLAGIDISGYLRYYLPNSKTSQDSGSNGLLRTNLKFKKQLTSSLTFEYNPQLRYYLQSNRSLVEFDEYGRVLSTPKAQTSWRTIQEVGLDFAITDKLTLGQTVGVDHALKYEDPGVGVEGGAATTFDISTGLTIDYLEPLSFSLVIAQSHDISADREDDTGYSFYNPNESQYWLIGFLPL